MLCRAVQYRKRTPAMCYVNTKEYDHEAQRFPDPVVPAAYLL